MSARKGFTLIEIIVVMVIIGILAAIAVPSYNAYNTQGAAKAAQENLIAIYNAQKADYINNNTYYTAGCPDTLTNINSNLSLNITDNNFTYCCTNTNQFTCTATGPNGIILTLTNNPIVLNGGASCGSNIGPNWVGPTAGCNPSCNNATYCP